MPEAVIVATARTPIGRAFKGSLKDVRPDDLAATHPRPSLDKVPALDPATLDDLMLGCAEPEGEQGVNIARRVAVALGYDALPGTTVNRFCASSVQTSRMAFHAIKAGEGARLRLRRRRVRVPLPRVRRARAAAARSSSTRSSTTPGPAPTATADDQRDLARPARGRRAARRLHRDGPDRREPRHLAGHHPRRSRTSSACGRRTSPRRPSPTGSSTARSRR